jgi:hypothetical protein
MEHASNPSGVFSQDGANFFDAFPLVNDRGKRQFFGEIELRPEEPLLAIPPFCFRTSILRRVEKIEPDLADRDPVGVLSHFPHLVYPIAIRHFVD